MRTRAIRGIQADESVFLSSQGGNAQAIDIRGAAGWIDQDGGRIIGSIGAVDGVEAARVIVQGESPTAKQSLLRKRRVQHIAEIHRKGGGRHHVNPHVRQLAHLGRGLTCMTVTGNAAARTVAEKNTNGHAEVKF